MLTALTGVFIPDQPENANMRICRSGETGAPCSPGSQQSKENLISGDLPHVAHATG
jgi:hypothetical protein